MTQRRTKSTRGRPIADKLIRKMKKKARGKVVDLQATTSTMLSHCGAL